MDHFELVSEYSPTGDQPGRLKSWWRLQEIGSEHYWV